ncbi:MAG: response regulator transcription factor [Sulfuricella sp.]|nr:response regulator transcription factor [Sulfuricella sp.]
MKICFIEDSPEILNRLRAVAAEIDGIHVVAEANTQEGALHAIHNAQPDVVILDLHLASGSGMEVLRQARPARGKAQFIVLTNHGFPQYRDKCFSLGADHFLDKSRDFGKLSGLLSDLAGSAKPDSHG